MNGVQLLLVIIAAIAVTGLANRRGLQAPLVVVTVALLASFIPGLPRLELDPEIILGLVLITAFAVAGVAAWVVPGMAIGAAFVLGAVVAPPDAVTAVAIGRRLGVPKRVMTILTGESLVNDAAALTLFSVGVAAVAGTHTVLDNPVLFFGYAAAVGLLVGLLIGVLVHWIRLHLHDPGLETVLGLIVPFAAYLLAEELHASGVLAVVMAGFTIGHNSAVTGYATRLQERQVWRSLDVLLEAFVFAYMGLQLHFVIEDVVNQGEPLGRLFAASLLVLLVAIAIRPAWVFLVFSGRVRSWKLNALISWTGMRGVVTLAAASGIPLTIANGSPFPSRASIQFIAFVVAVGTLLIQGATLPALVRELNISTAAETGVERRERRRAQSISRTASRRAVAELIADPPDGIDPALLNRIADRLREAHETRVAYSASHDQAEREATRQDLGSAIGLLRQRMLSAQRTALVRERDAGTLDDEVLRDELEELDYEEAVASTRTGFRL